jgi:DNA modification methylase
MVDSIKIRKVKVDELLPYARNSRTHSDAQVAQIAASITEFGWTNPILADGDKGIIAGHGRLLAARKLGMDTVPVIELSHLTKAQKQAYIIADNKLALNAGWDDQLLILELTELKELNFDINLIGFDTDELNALLEPDIVQGLTDEDAVPDVPIEPVTKLGDIYQLGNHRLMCGDSTSIDAVEKLMDGQKADMVFTDPPYGVSANGGRSDTVKKLQMKEIANDDLRGNDLKQFIVDSLSLAPLVENGSFYVCYDQKTQHEFTGALKDIGWKQKSTLIWNKNVFGLSGFKGYRPKFELIAFGYVGNDYTWYGDNSQSDVWDIPRPTERHGNHPTVKPIQIIKKALINSSMLKSKVLDLFGGSGSTMIACEELGRYSYLMELDPKYCDVIVKRWEDFTGNKAVLLEA